MSNKELTPEDFRRTTEAQLKDPSLALKGKDAATVAQARAKHYSTGAELLKQVSVTLQQIAATHSDPTAKQQATLAVSRLSEAQNAFGNASLCQPIVHDKDNS
ncbi:MAG TPA: hypothetical protein VFK12_08290 [Gammaproteobacteria bacterium]|nr:hypothetical protein [Gammaproteobacteria bacterium]